MSDLQFSSVASQLASDNWIDELCDEFERAYSNDPRPDLATYVARAEAATVKQRLFTALLAVEVEQRTKFGEVPTREEYLRQFPAFAAEIQAEAGFELGDTLSGKSADTIGTVQRIGKISKYELIRKIGVGGMGEVWEAHDTILSRKVALKFPRATLIPEQAVIRFLREGRAAAQLKHQGIVAVHDVCNDGDTVCIVTDLIEGQDLAKRLKNERLSWREATELCAEIGDALHHAHSHNVVHRDLKPANILLDRAGRPHITDFGLAKLTEEAVAMTKDGQLFGTPAYMAPEQARGESSRSDARTDVYALGVMLYEMLNGTCPFVGTEAALLHAAIHAVPAGLRKANPSIPRDLETICLKAIEKIPNRRYPSAQDMVVDLRRVLRGEPIYARRVTALERGIRWFKKKPMTVTALLLAGLTLSSIALALNLAAEKDQLLGIRSVRIATEPANAEVVLYPLDPNTGEPLAEKRITSNERSPLSVKLLPGNYLVVAASHDDRTNAAERGFHEVYRHVPRPEEKLPGHLPQQRWNEVNGEVVWSPIKIPPTSVVDTMALVTTQSGQQLYVDPHEVTVDQWNRVLKPHSREMLKFYGISDLDVYQSDDYAMCPTYEMAAQYAEVAGCRIPSKPEFDALVATQLQALGESAPESTGAIANQPVMTPSWDRLEASRPVYGLVSNLAEWTSTLAFANQPQLAANLQITIPSYRQVSGLQGKALVPPSKLEVKADAKVGFRCVRSIKPRLQSADFYQRP